ncbi:hypothetical protein [Lactiplantibacillus plantarum]
MNKRPAIALSNDLVCQTSNMTTKFQLAVPSVIFQCIID